MALYPELTKEQTERIETELSELIKTHALETKPDMLGYYEGAIQYLLNVVWWFGREDDSRSYKQWANPYLVYLESANTATSFITSLNKFRTAK